MKNIAINFISVTALFMPYAPATGAEAEVMGDPLNTIFVEHESNRRSLSADDLNRACYYLQINTQNAWHNQCGFLDAVGIGTQSPTKDKVIAYTYHAVAPIQKSLTRELRSFHSFGADQLPINPSVVVMIDDQLPGCEDILQ